MVRTLLPTGLAVICFAGNSLLCRQALRTGSIDPATFTLVRIGSGALMLSLLLSLLLALRRTPSRPDRGWRIAPAVALFLYAACFSFAYVGLDAGIGAIVLFGSVQATMIVWGMARGERPRTAEWAGLVLAFGGLVWLVLPGTKGAPSLPCALLMAVSGAAWGAYSSLDRCGAAPLEATAVNFRIALVPAGALALAAGLGRGLDATPTGVALAVTSGALASGIGYSIWYSALPRLSAAQAAVVQLSVPVIAAAGGILLLGETLLPRFVVAAAAILGGAALAVLTRSR